MNLLGQWVKVSLCLYCNSGLSGSLLAVSSEWLIRLAEWRDGGKRRGDESGSRRAGSWLGVLTPHLTSMGTELPLLPSKQTVGTRGTQPQPPSPPHHTLLLAGPLSSENWHWTDRDMTGQDSSGSRALWGFPLQKDSWSRLRHSDSQACFLSFISQILVSQPVSRSLESSTLWISSTELICDSDSILDHQRTTRGYGEWPTLLSVSLSHTHSHTHTHFHLVRVKHSSHKFY